MKTSIDLPDDLYRRIKSKSALEGRAVREVATALFTAWVEDRIPAGESSSPVKTASDGDDRAGAWLDDWKALSTRISARTRDGGPSLVEQLRTDRR